jgi:putative membrane protein
MIARRTILIGVLPAALISRFAGSQPVAGEATKIDVDQIRQTRAIGAFSLLVSKLAVEKINIPRIKEFALLEIAEQNTLMDVLSTLQNSSRVDGMVKLASDSEIEQYLAPEGRELVDKMRRAEPDTNFARDYFLLQMEAHQQLLQIYEGYLKTGRHPVLIAIAKLADGMIREHLVLLGDIKSDMGTGTRSP